MLERRVALVTGGNRGIGLEICRQLAKEGVLVILTSRDEEKGLAACEHLNKDELIVRYHPLDVTHAASVLAVTDFLKNEFGRCDILVNNAGIFPDTAEGSSESFAGVLNVHPDTMRLALETNTFGPMVMSQALIPLMKDNGYGRIVNMSSGMGQLSEMNGGYPAYRMSKTALNALTRIFSQEFLDENILVNSMCPGWVRTKMGGAHATRSVEEGADTAVWLATLPDDGPTGGFFRDRKPIPW